MLRKISQQDVGDVLSPLSPVKTLSSNSASATKLLGARLAGFLPPGTTIGLIGELGTGKTQFVKGIAAGLGIPEAEVVSPSFGLINIYAGKKGLCHADLYRLETLDDIATIGLEDFPSGNGLCVVEWADRLGEGHDFFDIIVYFKWVAKEKRALRVDTCDTLKDCLQNL
jgi:tRNA threonylcarbamoyladenosine biosynthesis protein TsaE